MKQLLTLALCLSSSQAANAELTLKEIRSAPKVELVG
jgi:hypothetical protein